MSPPSLMVVVDYNEATIYAPDANPSAAVKSAAQSSVHLVNHREKAHGKGQRALEDTAFYKDIATALAGEGKIVVFGRGTAEKNAGHQLLEYLRTHDHPTYMRVADQLEVDLTTMTNPDLHAVARNAVETSSVTT